MLFLIKNRMIGLIFAFIFNNPFQSERFLLLFHIILFIFLKKNVSSFVIFAEIV